MLAIGKTCDLIINELRGEESSSSGTRTPNWNPIAERPGEIFNGYLSEEPVTVVMSKHDSTYLKVVNRLHLGSAFLRRPENGA